MGRANKGNEIHNLENQWVSREEEKGSLVLQKVKKKETNWGDFFLKFYLQSKKCFIIITY